MASPYLELVSRRMGIKTLDVHKPLHDPRHYAYSREMTDGIPLEKTDAIEPLWKAVVGGILIAACIAVVIVLTLAA